MKLFFFPVAPNPTRVRVYLAEKGIEIEQVMVNLPAGEHKKPDHLARNPFGSLPVLELDDGSWLTESLAIIEYLEELHPDPPLIGSTPAERARVRETQRIAEMRVLGPVARTIHATNSPLGLPPNPEVARAAFQDVPRALSVLEDKFEASGGDFLCPGERPSIADGTLFAAYRFAEFAKLELTSPPGLHTLYERLQERWAGHF